MDASSLLVCYMPLAKLACKTLASKLGSQRPPRPTRFQAANGAHRIRTLLKFKIRRLLAVAALAQAVRLSALRLVRPPAARYTRSLSIAMSKRASDFDEAEATKAAKRLKVAELRSALEAAGADSKGLKAELVDRLVAAQRDGSAEPTPPSPPSAKKAKSPAKPQPDGQKIEIVRLDGKGAVQETLEAPQSYADARAAFGKLRHATTLDDGGSLELRVGGVAKLSTKDEKKKKKPAKKKEPAGPIPRSACPRTVVEGKKLSLLSVNVAGLRALLDPAKDAARRDALQKLVETEKPDVLCLNEHKLQESHVDAMKEELASLLPDYPVSLQHFTCSTAKKGYSGVAMLIRKGGVAEGADVTAGYETTDEIVQTEGRLLTLKAPGLPTVVATYVPNSGQKLDRLQYRCETWDRNLASYVKTLGSSTIVIGDLNCCQLLRRNHQVCSAAATSIPPQATYQKTSTTCIRGRTSTRARRPCATAACPWRSSTRASRDRRSRPV